MLWQHVREDGEKAERNRQCQSETEHADGRSYRRSHEAACTSKVPIIGPVQEKETNTNVNDMKKILIMPVVESAFVSSLFVQEEGNTISNAPKKEMAKTTNNKKNMILKIAFVDRSFSALAPEYTRNQQPLTR